VQSPFRGATAVETLSAILDLIRSSGTVSRTELIETSGLTGASITRIVRQLLDEGLIVETGLSESTGGKRRTLLSLNPSARSSVGISLDHDRIVYVVIDLSGRVLAEHSARGTGSRTLADVIPRIGKEVAALLAKSGVASKLVGIGVAVAGRPGSPDDHGLGSVTSIWDQDAIARELSLAIQAPVIVENDSTCAAIGEYWVGRLPSTEDFAAVYMTDGFGLGLVIDGHIYRGASSNAGEFGHVMVDPSGPECVCGRRGCLQAVGGMVRIVELALASQAFSKDYRLRGSATSTRGDFAKIVRAAARGDDRALGLIRQSAEHLASALVSIHNVLDLDQLVLAGPGFSVVGQIYADIVAEQLALKAFSRSRHTVRVGLSTMGNDVAALGAASLVLHSGLTRSGVRAISSGARMDALAQRNGQTMAG
jgi:predicted NBD/HSP70 family sugar kinase